MKLLLSSWMKELDGETIDNIGIPSIVLMENASRGAAKFFANQFPREKNFNHIIVMAGKGNNGGDGMAIGRILHQQGYLVQFLFLFDPDQLNPDPKINFNIIKKLNLNYTVVQNETHLEEIFKGFNGYPKNETVIIDALFGTGLNNPIKEGIYARAIPLINGSGFKVAAVDIPSGLSDAFLPEEDTPIITADVTAAFQCLKTAHLHPDGNKYSGKIAIIDIGIPRERVNQDKYYIDIITPGVFEKLLEKPRADAHKGDFGHALTIAGSVDKPGAGILSSFAVLRAGAGLSTTAVSYENRTAVVTAHPEIMTLVYKEKEDLFSALNPFDAVMAGPGMGNNRETFEIVSQLLRQAEVPLVLDADALNALQGELELLEKPPHQRRHPRHPRHPVIITPHPGEFARLTGRTGAEIRQGRIRLSREFALRYNVYVVLKGHHTIIAAPEEKGGRVFVNPTGNPGMATAGSGDVLSGIITGMICRYIKKYDLETILQAAVFIHGFAGDLAAREIGEISLTAGDIIDHLPAAFLALEKNDYQLPFNIS